MQFYEDVAEECEEFQHIPIQNIKGINLRYKQYGLCVAGAGLNIYLKSAKALQNIVKDLLPKIDGVANQIRQTESSKDGYELLWRVGVHCVKLFKVVQSGHLKTMYSSMSVASSVECYRLILHLTELQLTEIFLNGCVGKYTMLSNTYLTQLNQVRLIAPFPGARKEEYVLPDRWLINNLATSMFELMELMHI